MSLDLSNYKTIEEKKVIVDEWKATGLSMAEFCRRKELSSSTFEGWLNRCYPDRERKVQAPANRNMVKIQPPASRSDCMMEYRGARIHFSQSNMKDVLSALFLMSVKPGFM